MAGPTDNLGQASVKITADTGELKAKLQESEQVTAAAMGRMGDNVRGATTRFKQMTGVVTQTVGAVSSFVGAIGLVAGVAIAAGRGINYMMESTIRMRLASAEAAKSLEQFHYTVGLIQKTEYEKTLEGIRAEYDKLAQVILKNPDTPSQYRQLAAAEEALNEAYAKAGEARAKAEADAIDASANESLLAEQALFEFRAKMWDADRERERSANDARKQALLESMREFRALQEQINKAWLDAIKEQNRERIRGLEEFNRYQQSITAGFGVGNLGTADVTAIRRRLDQLVGRIGR